MKLKRREFSQLAAGAAGAAAAGVLAQVLAKGSHPPAGRAAVASTDVAMGTNLSGMEWARPGLRYGLSTAPNLHFSVPRKAEVAYLASCGFSKNRLPIQWELLQPMLYDTTANAEARAVIGAPGAFHHDYESFITGVLDAHAAVGMRCIIDNHNYCRYQDFRYQPDGAVRGLVRPPSAVLRPYTSDASQVQVRIFSLAPGATLTQAHFADFWSRAARKWKDHPGFGGYGLMNEPHHMPRVGSVVGSDEEGAESQQDLSVWPAYAQVAVEAIRAIDPANPIYVAGNDYSSAMAMGTKNPGFPLRGANLIYEVHAYLDAVNSGAAFDFAAEVAKNYNAGPLKGAIRASTGADRLRVATDWAREQKVRVALTEIGMPLDDPRWEAMFARAAVHAREAGCEIYTWMGGNHWPIRNYAMNHAPGWHQNKTLEPRVSGVLKAAAGIGRASIFDGGAGHCEAGKPLAVTVYARGSLARPLTLSIAVQGGGKLSRSRITLAAGANPEESFTYTPAPEEVAVISYSTEGGAGVAPPPPRRVYSFADPAGRAGHSLDDAAMAVLAKYGACKWDMADGHTDYVLGGPAAVGQPVRAVSDSGWGSSPGNAMEMMNWVNNDSPAMAAMALPVMRTADGRKFTDHSRPRTAGLWCKKSVPLPGIQPHPANRVPYDLTDPHFVIASVMLPGKSHSGIIFQASTAEEACGSELGFAGNHPVATFTDGKGRTVELKGPDKLPPGTAAVVSLVSAADSQALRLQGAEVAGAQGVLPAATFGQMLIGWGYQNYYPRDGFGGGIFAVVAGKGAPSAEELLVLERYLGRLAGISAA